MIGQRTGVICAAENHSQVKKDEIWPRATKQGAEEIRPGETSQQEKIKYWMISPVCANKSAVTEVCLTKHTQSHQWLSLGKNT